MKKPAARFLNQRCDASSKQLNELGLVRLPLSGGDRAFFWARREAVNIQRASRLRESISVSNVLSLLKHQHGAGDFAGLHGAEGFVYVL